MEKEYSTIEIEVSSIKSYQQCVKKGQGAKFYRTSSYYSYLKELVAGGLKRLRVKDSQDWGIIVVFETKGNKYADLDNQFKLLSDCLEHCGVISNDKYLNEIHLHRVLGCNKNKIKIKIWSRI